MSISIHESVSSDKVVEVITAESKTGLYWKLRKKVSNNTAHKIINALENNTLHGLHLDPNGKLRGKYLN